VILDTEPGSSKIDGAARNTFRRRDRLPEADFPGVARSRPVVRAAHFRVHARPNGLGRSRLGISVGRKFGGAVVRNRFKRIVREAFRTSREVRAAGLDIVVVSRDARALDAPEEIARALVRAAGG
jgi:ribonuclease P protein component